MTTLLISVGGGSYPNAPALRHVSFAPSSTALAAFFKGYGAGPLASEHQLNLFDDHRAWSEQLMAVRGWLRTMIVASENWGDRPQIQNVLVHYVGHGMFKANSEEHYLSINATDAEDRSMTSASLHELNDILMKNAPGQRRIYLIDACFAAASIRNLMGVPEDAIEIKVGGILGAWPEGDWGASGVAALCSASRTATASAGGERELTQFTDGLLSVLETGDEASNAALSLRRTHQLLRVTLRRRYGDDAVLPVLVAPEDGDGGIAAAPIFPNLARRSTGPDRTKRLSGSGALHGPSTRRVDDGPVVDQTSRDRASNMASAANDTPDFDVDVLSSTEGSMAPETDGAELASWSLVVEDAAASEMEASLNPEQRFRQAAYRFFRLPHSKKDKIARCLDPKGETSAAPAGLERYKAVLAKARDSGVVDQLESMIVTAERE